MTEKQKHIFSNKLNLIEKDDGENNEMMMTFCDDSYPPIISILESEESNMKDVNNNIKGDRFFKFNNSFLKRRKEKTKNNDLFCE